MIRTPPTSTLFPYTTLFRSLPTIILHRISDPPGAWLQGSPFSRSEEHTSELQSRFDLVCRLLLEKKKHHILLNDDATCHKVKIALEIALNKNGVAYHITPGE